MKKTVHIRDSGFLDDEDGISGRDSGLASTRVGNNKQNEPVSEDAPTPTDLISRKLKSRKFSLFDVLDNIHLGFYRNIQTYDDD